MTAPDDTADSEVPDAAGLPPLQPPPGGMAADPDSPDPVDLVPPRPGPSPTDDGTD